MAAGTDIVVRRAGMGHRSLQSFAESLNGAAWEILARRGLSPAEEFRMSVEECPVHGAGCARVTYGMLREHIAWARTDPAAAAATLLGTMLPPPGKTSAEGPASGSPEVPTPGRLEYTAEPKPASPDGHEVVEIPVLFTGRQAEALARASSRHGLSTGQLIRRAIAEFLARPEPGSDGGKSRRGGEAI